MRAAERVGGNMACIALPRVCMHSGACVGQAQARWMCDHNPSKLSRPSRQRGPHVMRTGRGRGKADAQVHNYGPHAVPRA
jgi:hypothetical protein